jgi:hypothetical protein
MVWVRLWASIPKISKACTPSVGPFLRGVLEPVGGHYIVRASLPRSYQAIPAGSSVPRGRRTYSGQ